jgi:hypothetical protein
MAKRDLEIRYQGRPSKFAMQPIDRKGLYGYRRRIALDSQGRECVTAHLTRDGRFLLPAGSTAYVYVNEHGDAVERSGVAVARAGDGSDHGGLEIQGPVPIEELLDHVAIKSYVLSPKLVDPRLLKVLRGGEIFRVPSESGSTPSSASFLLANKHGAFLVRAAPCGFDFVGLEQIANDSMASIEDSPIDSDPTSDDAFTFDFVIGGG